MIYSPFIYPTTTDPIGPKKGIFDIDKAIEAPFIATTSGILSTSVESTVDII